MLKHPNAAPYNQSATLYGRNSPPPSAEDAAVRIEALRGIIQDITYLLQSRTVSDFDSGQEYEDWKRRSSSAMARKEIELKYLNSWLNSGGRDAAERHADYLQLVRKSAEYARQTRAVYEVVFSEANPPKTVAEARERCDSLVILRENLEDFVTELSQSCTKARLQSGQIHEAKKPADSVLRQIIQEHTLLVRFLVEKEGSAVDFLLRLLDRVRKEGFVVSLEEQTRIEAIRKRDEQRRKKKF